MSTVGDMASSSVDADMDERDDSDALSITSDLDAPTPAAAVRRCAVKDVCISIDTLSQSPEGRAVKAFALWMKVEPELGVQELKTALERSDVREEADSGRARGYRRERDPNWLLYLAWTAAMKASAGGVEAAKRSDEEMRTVVKKLFELYSLKMQLEQGAEGSAPGAFDTLAAAKPLLKTR
ncbi:hypothetical protein OC844_005207 [Tilletia horrida]|nr:hypothetical protein OC844_005207 [Tilletia horrida]